MNICHNIFLKIERTCTDLLWAYLPKGSPLKNSISGSSLETVLFLSPSIASPLEIFFRHLVMSAAVRGMQAEMLTKGREPDDESSAEIQRVRDRLREDHLTCYSASCDVRCWSPYRLCPQQRSQRNQTSRAESVPRAKI